MDAEAGVRRILIVGDENSIARCNLDPQNDYEIHLAVSLAEAVSRQASEYFANIIIDPAALDESAYEVIASPRLPIEPSKTPALELEQQAQARILQLEQSLSALRESEGMLRQALGAEFAGSWEWDLVADAIKWSPENYELYGLPASGTGPTFEDWQRNVHPDDLLVVDQAVSDSMERREPEYRAEFRVMHPSRGLRWILGAGSVAFAEDGTPLRIVGINIDVTERKQAEEALRESEERFRVAKDAVGLGIYDVDLRYGTAQWDDRVREIWGFAPGEPLTSDMLTSRVHPEDREWIQRANDNAMDSQGSGRYQAEYRVTRASDGSERWVLANGRVFFDNDQPVRVIGTVEDVTARKQMEEALEQADRDKTDILESISDCFYALDRELRFIYVNKAAEDIWGLSRSELIGRNIADVFPGQIDLSLSKFREVLEEQVPLHYEVYSKVVQRWGDMSVYPTRDGISVFFQDTTERKQSEEALRESENKFSVLFHKGSVPAVVSKSPNHVFVDVNEAWMRMFGYTRDEVLGKTALEVGINRNLTQREMLLTAVESGAEVHGCEQVLFCKSGEARIVLTNVNPAVISGQRFAITSYNDITERKRADDALKRSQRLLGDIMDNNPSPVYVKDLQGRFIAANRALAEMVNLTKEEMIGKTTRDLFPARYSDVHAENDKNVLESGRPMQFEEHANTEDGVRTFLSQKFPLQDGDGRIYGVAGISPDITERKELEQRQQEKSLSSASRICWSASTVSLRHSRKPSFRRLCQRAWLGIGSRRCISRPLRKPKSEATSTIALNSTTARSGS